MQGWGGMRPRAMLVLGLLLAVLASGSVVLLVRTGERGRTPVSQDVPAPARLARAAAARDDRPSQEGMVAAPAHHADAGSALDGELRSNREAIARIDGMIAASDADAGKLRAQVARQDEAIAAQRQALGGASNADQGDAQAALSAAVEMNDLARAGLARYDATRSSLLERRGSLQQRNADIAGLLGREAARSRPGVSADGLAEAALPTRSKERTVRP